MAPLMSKGIKDDYQIGMKNDYQMGIKGDDSQMRRKGGYQMGSDQYMDVPGYRDNFDMEMGRFKKEGRGYFKSKKVGFSGMPLDQQDYPDRMYNDGYNRGSEGMKGGMSLGKQDYLGGMYDDGYQTPTFGRSMVGGRRLMGSLKRDNSTPPLLVNSWGKGIEEEEYDQPLPVGSLRSSLKNGLKNIGYEIKHAGREVKESLKNKAAQALDAVLDFAALTRIDQFRSFGLHHHECGDLTPEQVNNAPSSFFRVMSRQCFQDLSPDTLSAVPGMYLGRIRWWRDATAEQVSAILPDSILHVPFKRLGKKPLVIASPSNTMMRDSELPIEEDVMHPCLGITEEHEEVLMRDRKVWREYSKRCRSRRPTWTRWIPIVIFVLLILFLLFVLFYSFASSK